MPPRNSRNGSKKRKRISWQESPNKTFKAENINVNPHGSGILPNKSLKVWVELPRRRGPTLLSLSRKCAATPSGNRSTSRHFSGDLHVPLVEDKNPRRCRSYSIDSIPDGNVVSRSPSPASSPPNTHIDLNDGTSLHKASNSRRRSLSLDSVADTGKHESSEEDNDTQVRDDIYRPFSREVQETSSLHVPGETEGDVGKPVRLLDAFSFYDGRSNYVDFMEIDTLLTKGATIKASGKVSRCLLDETDSDSGSDIDEPPPIVRLRIVNAVWTDYEATEIDGIWNIRGVAVETRHGWYILKRPAKLYMDFFYRFWLAHYTTWNAMSMIRANPILTFDEFCSILLLQVNRSESKACLGRPLEKDDFEQIFVGVYVYEQLSLFAEGRKHLAKSSLIEYLVTPAYNEGYTPPKTSGYGRHKKTITLPLVHELTEGLFLKTLLKAGIVLSAEERANKLIQQPRVPDIMHPDRPTNIDWGKPIKGSSNHFKSIILDGETYSVGDVVMVKPGVDETEHRAKCALEVRSQARDNELSNNVWFCEIIYMYNKDVSDMDMELASEPTAHVRWYEHGSKTLLQENAHPYGLFAIAECNDVPVGSILGRCDVVHLKPGDDEPNDYHCAYVWDADEVRFLDISILEKDVSEGQPKCPSCAYNDAQKKLQSSNVVVYSEERASIRGIEYHINDLLYIASSARSPYQIGLVHRFIPATSQVKVRLFGRYDDVAGHWDTFRDETRLFWTNEFQVINLALVEGKCFLREKSYVIDRGYPDHFYADLESEELNTQSVAELREVDTHMADSCAQCRSVWKNGQRDVLRFLKESAPLRAMELFAGAGGLSTGLEQSGVIKTKWAIEMCPRAAATFQANHHESIVFNADTNDCLQHIIDSSKGKIPKALKTVNPEKHAMPKKGDVDLIAGGFPCQSFSGMNHNKRLDDSRTPLVANMLSYVEFYRPRFVLMENVKGLLEYHSKMLGEDDEEKTIKMSVVKFILRALLRLGYQAEIKILQAADYGSPQRRARVIIWGALRTEILPKYPLPTHVDPQTCSWKINLPTYDVLEPVRRSERDCAPFHAVVVAEAISDLPPFDWKNPRGKVDEYSQGYPTFSAVFDSNGKKLVGFTKPVRYASSPRSRYQRLLRGSNSSITLHCSRSFREQVIERVWYATDPETESLLDIPENLWTPAMKKASKGDSKQLKAFWRLRFGRLEWTKPFTTALTGCRPFTKGGKILHPTQRRILTARECARSQGFPDSYEFKMLDDDITPQKWAELMNSIHKQIGNAVPVPLANALGLSLRDALVKKWINELQKEEN